MAVLMTGPPSQPYFIVILVFPVLLIPVVVVNSNACSLLATLLSAVPSCQLRTSLLHKGTHTSSVVPVFRASDKLTGSGFSALPQAYRYL